MYYTEEIMSMSNLSQVLTSILQFLNPLFSHESVNSPHFLALISAIFGGISTLFALLIIGILSYKLGWFSPAMLHEEDRRRRLPQTILVIRHGESEANANQTLWKTIPDNLLGLTRAGQEQAQHVGRRAAAILNRQNARRVHLIVSPFERTLQTAHWLRPPLEHLIVRTEIESRIREQEVGNLQGDEFVTYRKEQLKVGRYFYRFPTGESGADVQDRVISWWHESVLTVNARMGYPPVDALIVVTHGLTMRFILTQLFGWSPTTFHSVWNAGNCDMYVLQKDLGKPGPSPYILCPELGDMPRSSIDVSVTVKDINKNNKKKKTKHLLKLENYLSIPPPRTQQTKLIKYLLSKQYPDLIPKPKLITEILFMPFIEGGIIRGRSTSGALVSKRSSSSIGSSLQHKNSSSCSSSSSNEDTGETTDCESEKGDTLENLIEERNDEMDDSETNRAEYANIHRGAQREMSLRYPCCFQLKDLMKGME